MNSSRTQDEVTDQLEEISEKIDEGLRSGKYTLTELQTMLVDKTKAAAQSTDDYVHENPWTSIAVVGGLGVIIGWLLARRD